MATRQDIRTRRKKQKQQQRLTTILIVAGVALIMAAVLMMPVDPGSLNPGWRICSTRNYAIACAKCQYH